MPHPELIYSDAFQLLSQGQVEDAYGKFLSAIEVSTQQLHKVKFIPHSILSNDSDSDFQIPISVIRSSLHCLEDIAKRKVAQPLPALPLDKSPPSWEKMSSPIQGDKSNTRRSHVSKTPPPLPPKPIFPPKQQQQQQFFTYPPSPASSNNESLQQLSSSLADFLHSGFDYDLIKNLGPVMIESSTGCCPDGDQHESEDDSDDDEELIGFNQHPTTHGTRPRSISDNTVRINTAAKRRPKSMTMTYSDPPPPIPRSSATVDVDVDVDVDVVIESVVDASVLVPAQTNTGDSLAPPPSPAAATMSGGVSSYVPHIPAPPLLTTYRRLQSRLDELEVAIAACKPRNRMHGTRTPHGSSIRSSPVNNVDPILQLSAAITEMRETLNRVRTLYMSAATIPDIMQFPPHLVAYQLTLIEFTIFRRIPPHALLTHSPRTPHPRIVASTDFFNYITRSIEHSILLPQEVSRRAELINRWIKIAAQCLSLNNYQTLKAIISALGTPPVQRLRRTWDCIPKKRTAKLELLASLMSEADNYGAYRHHMHFDGRKRCHKPVIPFLGVFIHDMTYLVAAVVNKGDPANDPRVQTVLNKVLIFQLAPPYPQRYPLPQKTSGGKSGGRKYAFRTPAALTNVINRNTTLVKQKVPALFGSDGDHHSKYSSSSSASEGTATSAMSAAAAIAEDHVGVQQQLITQYLLMRPWVHEKLIDELSVLREPPRPTRNRSASPRTPSTQSNRSSFTSSIFSNANSPVHRSSANSTTTSTRYSWEEEEAKQQQQQEQPKGSSSNGNGGIWTFRKRTDATRAMTLPSPENGNVGTWSDENNASESWSIKQQPPQASSMCCTSSATTRILSRNVGS